MNKPIAIGLGMLLGAILLTVAVWSLVQSALMGQEKEVAAMAVPANFPVIEEAATAADPIIERIVEPENKLIQEPASTTDETAIFLSEPESIYLRDLQLSDNQRKAAETFGVDVATFEITPTMIACAEAQVGAERLTEFKAGASPGFAEGLALLGCME